MLQNHAFIQAGQLSALAAISWVGWCAGLAGNALMCTYLASKQEAAAVRVQLIGIASNLVVLGQLWWAHVMPTNAFAGALAASIAIAVGGVLRSTARVNERQWLPFEALVGAAGVAAAPQVSRWLLTAEVVACYMTGARLLALQLQQRPRNATHSTKALPVCQMRKA